MASAESVPVFKFNHTAVGHIGVVREDDGLHVDVLILEGKQGYGRTRFLVTPIHGMGKSWVDESRILLTEVRPTTEEMNNIEQRLRKE